jgi:hypothetical protein
MDITTIDTTVDLKILAFLKSKEKALKVRYTDLMVERFEIVGLIVDAKNRGQMGEVHKLERQSDAAGSDLRLANDALNKLKRSIADVKSRIQWCSNN